MEDKSSMIAKFMEFSGLHSVYQVTVGNRRQ